MSYEQMEAMLVQRIAEVRASEALVLRAVEEARSNAGSLNLSTEYTRLQEQIGQVEHLLAAMESASLHPDLTLSGFVPDTGRAAGAGLWS